MNTSLPQANRRPVPALLVWGLAGWMLLLAYPALATIPVPSQVVYGRIAFGTTNVTRLSTNVVIELRRTAQGPAIASYRMGANPDLGDYYSLNVALEALDPASSINPGVIDPTASTTGAALVLLVWERTALRYQSNIVAGVSGTLERLDFGAPSSPSGNPIDEWQRLYLGRTGVYMNFDPTGKGQTLMADYIAGTNPNDTNSLFKVEIQQTPAEVSFFGIRAEGPGYAGLARFYRLEHCPDLDPENWVGVPGFTNVLGNNATIRYTAPNNGSTGPFYRAFVRLGQQ